MTQRLSPESIRAALDTILPAVQKPSRYLGIERNLVRKPWHEVGVRVALAVLLDEPQREIIVLRDFEGLSYDEVAHVLGIARGTVMSRLHRARRRLADEVRRRTGGGAS